MKFTVITHMDGIETSRKPWVPTPRPAPTEHPGRALWAEWHQRSQQPVADPGAELRWLKEDFAPRIPGASCNCQRDFLALLTQYPPDFTNYFAYTVEIHNRVNMKLTKAIVPLSEAVKIWIKSA